MTEIFVLANDRHHSGRWVKQGLDGLNNVSYSDDLNTLQQELIDPNKQDKSRIVVMDFDWFEGYEFLIQEAAPKPEQRRVFLYKTPIVLIHAGGSWVSQNLRQRMQDNFNIVGLVSVKDSFIDFTREDKKSRLHDVLASLIKKPQPINPELFSEVILELQGVNPTKKVRGNSPRP